MDSGDELPDLDLVDLPDPAACGQFHSLMYVFAYLFNELLIYLVFNFAFAQICTFIFTHLNTVLSH